MEYKYDCNGCNKRYTEIRGTDESQYVTICDACGGLYVEVND
jgi:rRNA maturation endonuclease Nob1